MAMSTRLRRGGGGVNQGRSGGRLIYEDFKPVSEWKYEEGADIFVYHLPGFVKEQIRILAESKGVLRVRGERFIGANRCSRFEEEVLVPKDCNMSEIRARFEGGILRIIMPKKIRTPTTRPIEYDHTSTAAPDHIKNPVNSEYNTASTNTPDPIKPAHALPTPTDKVQPSAIHDYEAPKSSMPNITNPTDLGYGNTSTTAPDPIKPTPTNKFQPSALHDYEALKSNMPHITNPFNPMYNNTNTTALNLNKPAPTDKVQPGAVHDYERPKASIPKPDLQTRPQQVQEEASYKKTNSDYSESFDDRYEKEKRVEDHRLNNDNTKEKNEVNEDKKREANVVEDYKRATNMTQLITRSLEEDRQLVVNMGVAILVIMGLGAYISYLFGSTS